jgi:RNA polymerase sigma factor (sigma-70 family)
MPDSNQTRWSVVFGAARGEAAAREEFALSYEPIVRRSLGARWHGTPLAREIDDAVQEVFLDCLREGGALTRVDPDRGGFRGFLFGVTRNVALRQERSRHRKREQDAGSKVDLDGFAGDDERLSVAFDRAWASHLLEQAALLQARRAEEAGAEAVRRVELLALRFEEDLPIREIAGRWEVKSSWLHHQYAQAREEYRRALQEVVSDWAGGSDEAVEAECRRLIDHFE